MAVQNYRVNVSLYGPYPGGSILPEYVVRAAGPIEEQIAQGIIEPTSAAVNVELMPMTPKPPAHAAPDVIIEKLNAARKDSASLREDLEVAVARAQHAEERRDVLEAELARYVEVNAHLSKAADDHQAKIDELEAELAKVREPKPAPAPVG
jgi:hypothetical protein